MKRTRMTLAGLLALTGAIAVAGCGGGGGGGGSSSNPNSVVTGKVVDVSGAVIPGATVAVENGPRTVTLSQGSYRLEKVAGGVRRIGAGVDVRGRKYSGSTQALFQDNLTVTNANIQVSPADRQATLTGTVFDRSSNRPISRARVFLAVNIAPPDQTGAIVTSLVAFSDDRGHYRLQNVPVEDLNGTQFSYTVAASVPGYTNTRYSGIRLGTSETRTVDFGLSGPSNAGRIAPRDVFAQAFTQPNAEIKPHATGNGSGSAAGAYEKLRRLLSPAYARRVGDRHTAHVQKRIAVRPHVAGFGSYAVENDVFWENVGQPNTLVGFNIYQSVGQNSIIDTQGNPVRGPLEFLQDPLANFYADFDPFVVAGQQYNYAVEAFYTDNRSSGFSRLGNGNYEVASVVPLGLLSLTQPSEGQTLFNPVTISWNPVRDAASYAVFVYNEFPTVDSEPIVQDTNISSNANAHRLTASLSGGRNYYVVVAAIDQDGTALSFSRIVKFRVG